MSIWHIIIKNNENDIFDKKISSSEEKYILNTVQLPDIPSAFGTNIFKEFRLSKIEPRDAVEDLLHLSLGVYTTDQVVSRKIYGFQEWSRHFKLYMPVTSLEKWENAKEDLEKLLSFLSGDKWEIYFRQKIIADGKQIKLLNDSNPKKIEKVALFSGGMDSFIGAIDLLESKNKVSFVSHYKRGADKSAQTKLYDSLRKKYGDDSFINYQFYLQPNQQHENATKEETSRARSFLFLCLGLIIANTLDEKIDFIVPENGLISLNVPLTGTRLSSHSTRTTHPYYLSTFKKVILELGINNKVINPYQWKTKGEMMIECDNQNLLKSLNAETLSCSHSENSRYSGMRPGIQCGYCVPCIIRQAAEKKGGIMGTKYVHNISQSVPSQKLVSGSDIRAFKLSLKRLETKSIRNIIFDILSSGPLPFENRNQLNEYINVYQRGMKEVKEFLE
ncbi:Qat anti-phage system QueC-like protein QatC [Psychroserpens algicola]|uniref:7-cyano-7-deazaguanine synthase (Queuosine biosynthesis) n=1 Tax=Psychroserpens algicola TaxID=1719034 RepID=A0ABT0H9D2_9FLAO|nr:Qat anti-phage system QueC-like protein QatC [Psychroserpens algicola]MCK8480979.1 hypothetical protein [Psychroserpens algicola]